MKEKTPQKKQAAPDLFPVQPWALFLGKARLQEAEKIRLEELWKEISGLKRGLLKISSPALNPSLVKQAFRLLRPRGKIPLPLSHPLFTLWASLTRDALAESWPAEHAGWSLLGSHLQEFAFSQALLSKGSFETIILTDAYGHIHLHGMSAYLDFGPSSAFKPFMLRAGAGKFRVLNAAAAPRLQKLPLLLGRIEVDFCSGLLKNERRITTHSLGGDDTQEFKRFIARLEDGLSQLKNIHPEAFEEIAALVRLVVPLRAGENMTSVSSTSSELPGAVLLSHCEDALVQAETLVHEASHRKLNLFTSAVDPLVKNTEAAYYSPLKSFPRPLSYILFAAHAFIAVADFLSRRLERGGLDKETRSELELYTARRLFEVELELSACAQHGKLTEKGKEFLLVLFKDLGRLNQTASFFDKTSAAQAHKQVQEHREKNTHYPALLFKAAAAAEKATR